MTHQYHDSASIEKNKYCKECHFPIVFVCCNGSMADWSKKYNGPWDWWVYCSNKACFHHHGEGLFQNTIKWMYKDDTPRKG